jgi:hypothetical protein
MADMKAVQAAWDATHAANAAEPYVHDVYEAAWGEARRVSREFYGPILGELAEEVWLDCNEVWSLTKLAEHYVSEHHGAVEDEALWLNYRMGALGEATDPALHDELEVEVKRRWTTMLEMTSKMVEVEQLVGRARTQKEWIDAALLSAAWSRLEDHGLELRELAEEVWLEL